MKFHVATALAIIITLVGTVGCSEPTGNVIGADYASASDTTPTSDKISARDTLCAVVPLSGDLAIVGQDVMRGMELAAAEQRVRLRVEDDGYEKQRTATATHKLLAEGCRTIIIVDAATGSAAAPIIADAGATGIIMQDRTAYIDAQSHLRTIGFDTAASGEIVADFAVKRGARNALVLQDGNEWSVVMSDAFTKRFEEYEGTVTRMVMTPQEDFTTVVTKAAAMRADVVYFPIANEPALFVKRAREQRLDALLLASDAFTDDQVAAAGPAADGMCKADVPFTLSPRVQEVLTAYTNTYKSDAPAPIYVMMGYDVLTAASLSRDNMNAEFTSVLGDRIMLAKDAPPRVEKVYCIMHGEKVEQKP